MEIVFGYVLSVLYIWGIKIGYDANRGRRGY